MPKGIMNRAKTYGLLLYWGSLLSALHAQTLEHVSADSLALSSPQKEKKLNFVQKFVRAFSEQDTTYITPNRYNWAFMLQNTNSFESYKLNSRANRQQLNFYSKPTVKVGPYFGWRWIFLGYTFDVNSLGNGGKSRKTEFELSLYSAMLGCDLIYRHTGSDFMLHKVKGFGPAGDMLESTEFDGISVKTKGINVYYIFNHKRFSYPAAFAQSSVQRKSCGTWSVGLSYTHHELDFDTESLPDAVISNPDYPFSENFMFRQLKYSDFSVNCGYAYNWVFKRNMLLCVAVTPSIGYTKTHSLPLSDAESGDDIASSSPLRLENINIDVTSRVGLVWNNTKYFAGLSLIAHNFNYWRNRLALHNTFGTLNFYIGFNFHKRKQYR